MKMLNPGLNDISNADYHGDRTYFSSSALKLLLKDKSAFHKKYILNEKEETKINHNFVFGSLVHALILEPHLVEKEFAVWSGSKGTEAYKEFLKEHKGKDILTNTAWGNGQFLLQSVKESPHWGYVTGGNAELTFCGNLHGMPIKVRADYIKEDYILDIKTTSMDISDTYNIQKACENYGYALSAALYMDMFKKKFPIKRFLFWFINKQSGANVLIEASDEFIEHGRKQCKKAAEIYKEAIKNNTWQDSLPKLYPLY